MRAITLVADRKLEIADLPEPPAPKAGEVQVRVASALCGKGRALESLGRPDEAIAAFQEVVPRFGEATEAELRAYVAGALAEKGAALARLGRRDEAVRAYDELLARSAGAAQPQVLGQVRWAIR